MTFAEYDHAVCHTITEVCVAFGGDRQLRADCEMYAGLYKIKLDMVTHITEVLATAACARPAVNPRTAAAGASASIADYISQYDLQGSISAADVAVRTVASVDDQVVAAAGKRGLERLDLWNYIILVVKDTVRSISEADSPRTAAGGVAGAFQGLL